MKLLKQATYIRYVIAKLSKFVQIKHTDLLTFLFTEEKKFSIVILHKLAKFHCQTVLTSEVIQLNVLLVSCLGI